MGRNFQCPCKIIMKENIEFFMGKQPIQESWAVTLVISSPKDFLDSSDSHALILEDDIEPPSNIMNLIDRALSYCKYWNLLRLTSFTPGEHLAFAEIGDGYNLSYNLKVLKNTGAYVIDRWAAQCLLQKMQPMFLPYDVALDREWHYGFKTAVYRLCPSD